MVISTSLPGILSESHVASTLRMTVERSSVIKYMIIYFRAVMFELPILQVPEYNQ